MHFYNKSSPQGDTLYSYLISYILYLLARMSKSHPCITYFFFPFTYTISTAISAGETPEMRAA